MLYGFLKILVGSGAKIFCRKIVVNKPSLLNENGPLLIASNHPNSFLDGVLLDILFKRSVWSLARGDAFINKFVNRILTSVRILPVYRTSEGVENLSSNYETFDACLDLFRDNGVVQIFSEGRCVNEWHLRPLKKGTARLALMSWEQGIPLRVLPVGINYSSFTLFGKNVFLNFGEIITKDMIDWNGSEGNRIRQFNEVLENELRAHVFEINKDDKARKKELMEIKPGMIEQILLFIPAIIGFISHAPLYLPLKLYVKRKYHHTDHYDSVLTTLLIFTYPFYLAAIILLLILLTKNWWVLTLLVVLPFTAWSLVRLKKQTD